MKKKLILFLFVVSYVNPLFSQPNNSEVLLSIDDREVTLDEFERIYKKNNNDNIAEKQTVEEYLDMFINFKLKVIEAQERGLDTTHNFLNEFNSYKQQLAKPYLTDPDLTEEIAREAYERMKKEVHAGHIMVRLDEKASPEDTLFAYNKLLDIRERIMNGEDFETIARATSDDPSAKRNGGDLGWFSAFKMVYPFETAAFHTPPGEISMPFRTRFGYHILKVHEVRNARGSVKVAHLFVRVPESLTNEEKIRAKEKIDLLYDSLQNEIEFSDLAKRNSEDPASARNGGELPQFSSGQMIPEFENAAFELEKPGEISEPVRSFYGWHIIKLLDKKPLGSFEEEKPDILPKLSNGERAALKTTGFVNKLKNEYNYEFYPENLEKLYPYADTGLFNGTWGAGSVPDKMNIPLFVIADTVFTVSDFALFLEDTQVKRDPYNLITYINESYGKFEQKMIMDYEESVLAEKYPEYRHILQEYHDGILLFELTDKMVWSKAVQDSTGLEKFYKNNTHNYMWDERAEAYTVSVNDSSLLPKARKFVSRFAKRRKFSEDFLLDKLCPDDTTANCIDIKLERYEKGVNEYVDKTGWNEGIGDTYMANGTPSFVYVTRTVKPQPKELDDVRGLVTADYQDHLEKKWIKELREKYEIKINRDLLSKIK